MATALSVSAQLTLSGTFINNTPLGSPAADLAYNFAKVFTDGSGVDSAQVAWRDSRTIAASGNDDLDLNGTALQNAFGINVGLTKLKGLIVVAKATNTNDVVVGGAASNGLITMFGSASDKIKVQPGGMVALFNPTAGGYTVTPGTGDMLRIANSGAGSTVGYDIILIGV